MRRLLALDNFSPMADELSSCVATFLDLDALANALLASSCDFPDLDKCSTLPSKRQMYDAMQPGLRRPASAAGQKPSLSLHKV